MIDLRTKRDEFRRALHDPFQVAKLLQIPPISPSSNQHPSTSVVHISKSSEKCEYEGIDWSGVLSNWLDACQAADAGQVVSCYESQAALHASFNQLFSSSMGNLLVPALHTVCKMTHKIAIAADLAASTTGSRDYAKLQNAATLLQESFSRTINDRKEFVPRAPYSEEGSKKAGVLLIVNELFAIYFRLNTLRLCKNLLRPVEGRKLHEDGSLGQMVTYRYYTGRLALFEDQYSEAEANLQFAFDHCHYKALRNKQAILRYLVPVKLYRGRLPSPQLLQKYQLIEFVSLVDSIRKGDLRTFNDALVRYQHSFIRQGTYLLLEKCKTVCYRNLFKRIHYILEKHQILLEDVASAFKWLGMPIDLDEVECILANLIYRGYIRGYLSHSKRVLVLSKRDPFPVSTVIAK